VPLLVREAPYGAISLYYRGQREIQPEEVRLAQSIANQAALAVESAELRDQAQQSATVAERNRLARELHDSVTQNLYSVTLYAEAAARLLENGSSGQAASYLRDLRDTSQEALREMRLLIFELRPPELEKTGLATAIQMRLQSVEARGGMQASLNLEGVENEARVPVAVQQELYQITQEALNNTLKHSKAARVVVTLTYGASGIWLEVADDGVGFDASELQGGTGSHSALGGTGSHSALGGMGLGNLRERAARIGARLAIESAPGSGTRVMVTRPHQ
jgi:signal transduction histidine kinase